MTLHSTTITLAILLLLYHQLTTWLPLFPWNDVANLSRKDILLEACWNGLVMGSGVLFLLQGYTGGYKYYPLIYYPFLLTGEIFQWWLPYFSPGFAKSKHNFDYGSRYSRTLKWLPHCAGERTPDANHTVLHLLTMITVVLVFADYLSH